MSLRQFGFTPAAGWPKGFYELSEGVPVAVVVLSELDDTPDPVALRLMSRRESLNHALRTLRGRAPAGRAEAYRA